MYSVWSYATLLALGCPIRKFPGLRLLPPIRDLSQVTTSFIAYQCQGIHRVLLVTFTKKSLSIQIELPITLTARAAKWSAKASINLFIYGKTYIVKRTTIYHIRRGGRDYREIKETNLIIPGVKLFWLLLERLKLLSFWTKWRVYSFLFRKFL